MSIPFTINAENWQQKAEELRLAYSERYCANAQSASKYRKFVWRETDAVTGAGIWEWQDSTGGTGDVLGADGRPVNLQAASFWRGMQDFIETYFIRVLDPAVDYTGADEVGFNASTFAEFCEYVGGAMYTSADDYGFPRAGELDESGTPILLRGKHEEGAYIGAWLIDSLRECFAAWTKILLNYTSNTETLRTEYTWRPTINIGGVTYHDVWVKSATRSSVYGEWVAGRTASYSYSAVLGYRCNVRDTSGSFELAAGFPLDVSTLDLYGFYPDNYDEALANGTIPSPPPAGQVALIEGDISGTESGTYGSSTNPQIAPGLVSPPPAGSQSDAGAFYPRLVGVIDFTNGPDGP